MDPTRTPHHHRSAGPLSADLASAMVEQLREYALILLDAEGVIVRWGEGARRLAGYTAAEAEGRPLSLLYPAAGAEDGTADDHLRATAAHGECVYEGTRVGRGGRTFTARVALTALRGGGELLGFAMLAHDVGERNRASDQLREAVRAADDAGREKSRFLATMSHEIRTPINAILGYADLLDVGVAGPLTAGQREYLDRVRSSGRHLLALIEDVLDFARVDAGRLTLSVEQHRLGEVVDAAASLLAPQAEAAGLTLATTCDAAQEFWGDRTRVQQILVNLLTNAVKFTPRGGAVRLACGPAVPGDAPPAGDGPWATVRVEDTGIGIPADRLEAVFEPFVQVENSLTRTHAGSGLGLAISRRLARQMGGDLRVRSAPGAGTTFTLWLPAAPFAAGEDPNAEAPLTIVAQQLGSATHQVVRKVGERLRMDPHTASARGRTRGELEDHLATLLTDMAQMLMVIEEDGSDAPDIAMDGRDVQRMLAERHGRQRHRIGFGEAELRHEYDLVGEEMESALGAAAHATDAAAVDEARLVVRRLLNRAAALSVRAYREATRGKENGGQKRN